MSKISQSGAVCLFVVLRFVVLVLFSAVIHKRRGKKLISKTIKCKLDSSPKMQFAFFDPNDIQELFGNLSILSKIWKLRKQQGVGRSCSLRHYDAVRTKIDI